MDSDQQGLPAGEQAPPPVPMSLRRCRSASDSVIRAWSDVDVSGGLSKHPKLLVRPIVLGYPLSTRSFTLPGDATLDGPSPGSARFERAQ